MRGTVRDTRLHAGDMLKAGRLDDASVKANVTLFYY